MVNGCLFVVFFLLFDYCVFDLSFLFSVGFFFFFTKNFCANIKAIDDSLMRFREREI